jgi:membrane-bound metal-dependent hydrolase YbcI (DUF457 family)
MMAAAHAATGVAAGLYATALIAPDSSTGTLLAGALVCAGASLLPDLDRENSTASNVFGSLSRGASVRVSGLSRRLYRSTRTRWDYPQPDEDDGHRGMTHTLLFAVLAGVVAWAAAGVNAVLVVFPTACLAVRAAIPYLQMQNDGLVSSALVRVLRHSISTSVLGAAVAWIALRHLDDPVGVAALVALGCLVHCLGDSLTLAGCPWLWPMPILGRRWFRIGLPRPLRFRTGGRVEALLIAPLIVLGTLVVGGLIVAPRLLGGLLP